MRIRINRDLKEDLFGQFSATFLDKESKEIFYSNENGNPSLFTIREKDTITLDLECIKDWRELIIGVEYELEGIFYLYAKNPKKGAVLVVTKFVALYTQSKLQPLN